jgi:hypothetical protein
MDWTEAETRLATLEREVIHRQRLAQEHQALVRDDGRMAVVAHGPGRWLWLGHWLWRRLPVPAKPAPAAGDLIANAPSVA